MRLTWPLTGRSAETRRIEAAVLNPASSGIVVRGASGVGKSRIVRETLTSLGARGWHVRWVVGSTAAHRLPLGALAPWARTTGEDSLHLIHSVISALTSAPDGGPVVLGVDDAPLLDELSTAVLHQIIQRGLAAVVLTARDGDPVPAATRELWKDGELDQLDVEALRESDTVAMVSNALGPLHPDAAARLWGLTRGNPLYVRTIVEHEVSDGRLAAADGVWTWRGAPVVPPSLVEMVEARVGGLADPVGSVLAVVAVGEPIALRSLARISDAAGVEEADRRGLITLETVDGDVLVRLAHPLYGEVLRSRVPQTTLRRLRGLVATELGACRQQNDVHVVVRRGALSLDSDLTPDVALLLDAARGAARMSDLGLADKLAQAAVVAGGGAQARAVRAFVLSWRGDGRRAESLLAEVDPHTLTDGELGQLLFLRAVNLFFTLCEPGRAMALVDEARESGVSGQAVDAFLSVYWAAMGDPRAAAEYAVSFDRDRLPDHFQARLTAWAATVAYGESGQTARAVAAAESGYPVPVRAFIVIADAHITALTLAGQTAEAEGVAAMMRQRATASRVAPFGQVAAAVSGQAALAAGRLDEACAHLTSATEAVTAWNTGTGFGYRYRILLTTALAMRGMTGPADAAQVCMDDAVHPGWRYLDYGRAIARGWVAACHGAMSDAVSAVRAAAGEAAHRQQFAAEVLCLQTATQFGDASAAARLHELAGVVEGPRAAVAAHFATALSSSNPAELEAVSRRFEEIGDLVAAVDAAAYAAVCFRKLTLRGSALRCSTRAQALAALSGGARTPALRLAVEQLPLTDREREVVMLLAEPMSNRDIAARLRLSVRTVESHIYHAMAKTGAGSRDDLAALVADQHR